MLCVDEKSQVQALNRTQPILPLAPGVPARQSHDYVIEVTSLFAAMDVASSTVTGGIGIRSSCGFSIRSRPTFCVDLRCI